MGLEHRWPEVSQAYAEVNRLFGDIVKVTPTSKVVGDMALFMVANDLTPEDVPTRRARSRFPSRWSRCSRANSASRRTAFPGAVAQGAQGRKPLAAVPAGDSLPRSTSRPHAGGRGGQSATRSTTPTSPPT
jgi:pyruvate carboxylase